MRLKNTLIAVFAAVAALSCSNIAEDDRYIYMKPAEIGRSVLIEDFTGQKCSNCPTANDMIKSLQEEYGEDNVIAVGIHSGPLGFAGNSKRIGLMTDTGNEYYYSHTIPSQPYGVINRIQESATPDNWGTLVYNEIQKTVPVSIEIENTYAEATRTATIDVSMLGIDGVSGKLQVWVVEDSIVAMQTMQDGSVNYEYTHNHVFRAAVNGTWGEDVAVSEGVKVDKKYTFTLEENWVSGNVSVVAFVYNDDGVQQVAKAALTGKDSEE